MTDRDKIIETMARAMCRRKTDENTYGDVSEDAVQNYVDAAWRLFSPDAESALTALEASGMAVVPREPTEAMVDAGGSSIIRPSVYMGGVPPGAKRRARDIWADMLAASPTPTSKRPEGEQG